MGKRIKPFTQNEDGSVEWQCHKCSEPILMFPGDAMTVVVGDGGIVDGVLCAVCAKTPGSKEAKDGR